MSKIKLTAEKDAPEVVQQGNLLAEQKNGYFHTDNREFADSIIAQGFATEAVSKTAEAKTDAKSNEGATN